MRFTLALTFLLLTITVVRRLAFFLILTEQMQEALRLSIAHYDDHEHVKDERGVNEQGRGALYGFRIANNDERTGGKLDLQRNIVVTSSVIQVRRC